MFFRVFSPALEIFVGDYIIEDLLKNKIIIKIKMFFTKITSTKTLGDHY
jgi:hypothetical protein